MQLGRIRVWRHVVVLASIAVCAVLALIGVVGAGNRSERFDAKHVTVWPVGDDGLRIREVVDQDFGIVPRHGYERTIPNDFGVPTDVTATSPDAPDDLSVVQLNAFETRIRIGDPNVTITGQHRYVLEYTLPAARLSSGELALDVIGTDETLETLRFEVVVSGLELGDPTCSVGAAGTSGGCTLAPEVADGGTVYRTVISPLQPGQGITIGGTITGRPEAVEVPIPEIPERREDRRTTVALAMIPTGLLAAGAVFLLARRSGRNEVFAGGAAEAAYGALPAPGDDGTTPAVATTLVADDRLDELATIEFVPPKGVTPWQGQVLLGERVDSGTVAAWFSGLVADEAIELDRDDGDLVLRPGPRRHEVDAATAAHLDHLFEGRTSLTLGSYDKRFATVWHNVQAQLMEQIRASGWWTRLPASAGPGGLAWLVLVFVALAVFGVGAVVGAVAGLFASVPGAIVFGALLPAATAFVVYRTLLASRSATGSALTLRTESFRRFLDQSEARHVEWAWQQGLLREYSAWAVALGEADAWGHALEAANVPEADRASFTTPLLVHSMASSFSSSHTAPSSSSSGGGGFSGGSVGGGGGGGSSGSW